MYRPTVMQGARPIMLCEGLVEQGMRPAVYRLTGGTGHKDEMEQREEIKVCLIIEKYDLNY